MHTCPDTCLTFSLLLWTLSFSHWQYWEYVYNIKSHTVLLPLLLIMKWEQGKYFATKWYHRLSSPHKRMHYWLMGPVFHPDSILSWNGPKIMIPTDMFKCFGWYKERKGNCSYWWSQLTWKTTWLFSLCNVTNYYQRINETINNLCKNTEQLHPEL